MAESAKREDVSSPDEVGNHGLIQDPSPEPGLNALIRQWPAVWNGWREWLENLSEPELDEKVWIYRAFYPIEVQCSTPNEDKFRVPRWKMVLHAINHSTPHRGQVMGMLRTLGKQPPGTDLFNYYLAMAG